MGVPWPCQFTRGCVLVWLRLLFLFIFINFFCCCYVVVVVVVVVVVLVVVVVVAALDSCCWSVLFLLLAVLRLCTYLIVCPKKLAKNATWGKLAFDTTSHVRHLRHHMWCAQRYYSIILSVVWFRRVGQLWSIRQGESAAALQVFPRVGYWWSPLVIRWCFSSRLRRWKIKATSIA